MAFFGGGMMGGMGGYGMGRIYSPNLQPQPDDLDAVFRSAQGLVAANRGGPLGNALDAAVQFPMAMANVRQQQAGQSALNNLAAGGGVSPDLPVSSISDAARAYSLQSQSQQDQDLDTPLPPEISKGLASQTSRFGINEPQGGFTPRTAQAAIGAMNAAAGVQRAMRPAAGKPLSPLAQFLAGKGGQQEPQAGQAGQQPAPQAAPMGSGTSHIRVVSPDGRRGTWDLSKGPIPKGFRQE